jgi:hypothetical protein
VESGSGEASVRVIERVISSNPRIELYKDVPYLRRGEHDGDSRRERLQDALWRRLVP